MSDLLLAATAASLPAPLLTVEDESLIQRRLEGILYGLGYTAEALVFVSCLREARQYLATQPVAMALVDRACLTEVRSI